LQLRVIDDSERDRWNQLAASAEVADVLQSYEWGELKRAFGWVPHRVLLERAGKPVAQASLLERRLPIGKSLFYCSRGPLLDYGDGGLAREVLTLLGEYCRRRNGFLLKLDPAVERAAGEAAAGALRACGFRALGEETGFGGTQPRCVMKLDLTPGTEGLLAACKPKTRYNIRLAGRKGVEVRDDCRAAALRSFYDLLQVTAERDGFVVRSYAYFEKLMELLAPAGFARLFLAYCEDEPIAGALVTRFGATCCYLYGASANVHRERMPSYLVQWRMIEWAQSQGCSEYDFRGVSPSPEADDHLRGLNRFKAGFNARFVEYIGEFDLPLSRPHYYLWTVGRPAAVRLLKGLRKSPSESPGD
jgi:lipid II:glycine glycyltransferase (peptidoglycan interpeptide bridge formation enzyme)